MHAVDAYAADVVAGRIPAGKWHKLACARHLRDRQREGTPEFPYRFDLAKAEKFFRFAELLRHYKGEWAGQPIRLEPWQKFITGSVIGWVHTGTGLRRFRTAFNEVPRKNGKTLLAAVVLLYLTFFDGEAGAEGYAIATKRDQAKIVFTDAKQLVISSGLKERIKVLVANMHRTDTASKLEPLGADHDSTDGLNPAVVVGDEIHAMKDRGMLDVMETATGARRQPVIYLITTYGNDLVSPWGDQHDYATKILEGVLTDESFFVFCAHADPEDDWTSLETARKANPNYGISVNPDDLMAKVTKAQGIPAAAATYKQKHLNLLVNNATPCLSMDGWRAGQSTQVSREEFRAALKGQRCYAGIDLASKIDLCSLSLLFPPTPERPKTHVLQFLWTPKDTLKDRAHADRAPYPVWVDQGWLTAQDGTRIDHQAIRDVLAWARGLFHIELIGFDPWHADTLIGQLVKEDGFAAEQVLEVPQTYAGMSSAETWFKGEVLAGNVDANGCPVTAWAISNTVEQTDGKGNIFFTKKKSRGRIDPVKSMSTAAALWKRHEPENREYQVLVYGGRR
jgi:phage terminase large subunit-like protein